MWNEIGMKRKLRTKRKIDKTTCGNVPMMSSPSPLFGSAQNNANANKIDCETAKFIQMLQL